MKQSLIKRIFGGRPQPATRLLAVTPPRTGERTLLGVENLLGSIAVPEPFSLEIAGDAAGVTLLARCREGSFVKQQLGVHYPQARVSEVAPEDDPLWLAEGEQAWSMSLRLQGPEYLPLRTFRDDDLLDQGSDPLISVIGSLSDLEEGERLVARMKLLSLGPDWSRSYQEKADRRPQPNPSSSPYNADVQIHRNDGVTMAILGLIALPSLMGYVWIQRGETWKAVLLGLGMASLASLVGWAWWRIKKARSGGKHQDPLLIKEKVSRIAYESELEVTAVLSQHGTESRARELLRNAASAYRGQLQGGEDSPRHSRNGAVAAPPGDVAEPERPGGQGGGVAMAPAGGWRRPAHGGPFRGQGAVPLGQGRLRRRPRGGHGEQQAAQDTLPR